MGRGSGGGGIGASKCRSSLCVYGRGGGGGEGCFTPPKVHPSLEKRYLKLNLGHFGKIPQGLKRLIVGREHGELQFFV